MRETEKVAARYNRISPLYDILEWPIERLVFGRWRERYLGNLEGKILEVGVGTGMNLRYYGKNADVTAIDYSDGMLKRAVRENSRLKRDYKVLKMDAQDLDFKDNTFDYVVTTFVLCSVPDPIKALEEMNRVVKKDGKIINIEHVLSKNWFVAMLLRFHNPAVRYCFGCNLTRNTVENVKKAGLKIEREDNIGFMDVFKLIMSKKD